MKKNISININGIIFHMEEDAYNTLRTYLDSVHAYFSSCEDSIEIIADIEGRIAELLNAKLKKKKEIIAQEDVMSLIEKMGSVEDFAINEAQSIQDDEAANGHTQDRFDKKDRPKGDKQLYRDMRGKVLGGVCAGLGYYFNIDPVWFRILFVVLSIGSFGTLVLIYLVFWVVMPASDNVEKSSGMKRIFRDPEHKMLGGVASGLAAFLGADITLIRLIFVISFFIVGAGILLYIMLWILLPEAKTITEKMQMRGKAVTLNNIKNTVHG